jgi:single-stranded DNA-specific DHH superfamily exonuclease
LFWNLHFDQFFIDFYDGMRTFTPKEKMFLMTKKDQMKQTLQNSITEELNGERINSLVVLCDDSSVINEFPYFKPGYDVYFMVTKYRDSIGLSVRSGEGRMKINTFCSEIAKETCVISSGGHDEACGITVKKDTSPEEVFQTIIKYHSMLDS